MVRHTIQCVFMCVCAQCTMYNEQRTTNNARLLFYYFVHTSTVVYAACYWSCLCCYRMLPSVKTHINHSFDQQEKKVNAATATTKLSIFGWGQLLHVWSNQNWIHTNTHNIYGPILFERVLKVYGRYMGDGQLGLPIKWRIHAHANALWAHCDDMWWWWRRRYRWRPWQWPWWG